ncbi:MAG: hypothetical protein ISS78_00140 [Phycisphaerae bacterium]|nr:hypothetical protein [Phycisphaerae bacterium]
MSEREEYSGDLSAYLDGELSQSRRRRLDEVLQYDQELARELDRLRATRELIRSLPAARSPRDFTSRVVARGERMRLLGSLRQPRSYRWITLAAAAVVLVVAGLSVVIMLELSQKHPHGTVDDVGRLALAPEGPPEGDAPDANGKKVGKVAKSGPPNGRYKETPPDGYKVGLESTLAAARRSAGRLPKDGGTEADFVIYTSNLAFAQRDVENVLAYNGIQPVRSTSAADTVPGKDIRARGNFFNTTQTTVSQVQIEVFVPPQQAVKLKNELNVIRAQQEVSQAAVVAGAGATARTPEVAKFAKVAPRKIDADAAEESADKKARDEGKRAPKAEPRPAKPTADKLDRKSALAYADNERPAKTEVKPVTKAKAEPAPKTAGEKAANRPKPAAKPAETGVAIAAKRGKKPSPAPAPTTRAAAGAPVARKAGQEVAEAEQRLAKGADTVQRPGEPYDGQKDQTAPTTAPARTQTKAPSTRAALAVRHAASQRVGQIESQAGANVMRLLITLNRRDARPPRATAEALRKTADQKAEPAAKNRANQSR